MLNNTGDNDSPDNDGPAPEQQTNKSIAERIKSAFTTRDDDGALGRRVPKGVTVLSVAATLSAAAVTTALAAPSPDSGSAAREGATPAVVQAASEGPNRAQAPAPKAPAEKPLETKIVEAAQKEIGTKETGENCQPYSSQCVSWCALFSMETWEQAGVNVDNENYAFTGDVYTDGQAKGTAYDSSQLHQAKPGDMLLFGTDPSSPSTSKHIGVVEKVQGDKVTLIEGNSGDNTDEVVRKDHTLSPDTFYGGVHPW